MDILGLSGLKRFFLGMEGVGEGFCDKGINPLVAWGDVNRWSIPREAVARRA